MRAMGQHDTLHVAKINRRYSKKSYKLLQNEQYKEQDIPCKYCDKTHSQQKKLCPAYGNFAVNATNPNMFRQSACQLQIQKTYSGETNQEDHGTIGTLREQPTIRTQRTLTATLIKMLTSSMNQ